MNELEDKKLTPDFLQKIFKVIPLLSIIGIVVGAIGGYIYHIQIGCNGT